MKVVYSRFSKTRSCCGLSSHCNESYPDQQFPYKPNPIRKTMTEQETLLDFPCKFSVKAMGLATDDFDLLVVEIINRHVPNLGEGAVRTRPSREGKYVSVTVTFEASSKAQLDAIYQALSANDRVLMSL